MNADTRSPSTELQTKNFMSRLLDYFSIHTKRGGQWWLKFLGLFFLVAVVVIVGIAFPVFRLVVRPRVKATIEDARLNRFAFADTRSGGATTTMSFLAYNVSATIRIHNPTWSTIKLTKPLLAAFAFHDHRLSTVSVSGKGHKYWISKKELHIVYAIGEIPSDVLGAAVVDDFKKQNKTGVFKIDVRLSGEIAYVGLDTIGNKREVGISCPTTRQLAPPGPEVVVFHEVNCKPEAEIIHF